MRWLLLLGLLGCESAEEAPVDAAPEGDIDARIVDAYVPDPDDGVPPPDATQPFVQVGTGRRRWEALEPGQEVPIIEGIQGGFHVWGAVRGDGFGATDVTIDFELHLDGRLVAEAHYEEPEFPRGDDGLYDYPAVAVIYTENAEVRRSTGSTMELSVVVTSGGDRLEDSVQIVPVCCE